MRNGSSRTRVNDPAGHTAVDPASPAGRQADEIGSEPRNEAPPIEGSSMETQTPTQTRPGPAPMKGQWKPRHKAHSLIDKVYDWNNLYRAWRRVRRNKGAHGLDRVTIRMFEADWEKHLREIQRKLVQRRYKPSPVRRTYIPKASDPKQRRPLGIPIVADRIVGQALLQILDPLFDDQMSERSFGFRKGRKAHDAIATAIRDKKAGHRHVVDADIKAFFDELAHHVVMPRVRARIADGRVLDLIEAFLKAGISEGGVVSVPDKGCPQGGVISPWLANLVLDDLDKALENRGYRHVRYADDFVVLCKSPEEAAEALLFTQEVVAQLQLSLHETKTRLTDFKAGFEFLGFCFRGEHIGIRPKSIERFKDKVRSATRRQQGRNVEAVLADLNPVLRGFAQYFGRAEVACVFHRLDQWVRMRIRAFKTQRKRYTDNHRLPIRMLATWGLLSLRQCRPVPRFHHGSGDRESRSRPLATRNPRGVAQCGNSTC